MNENPTTVEIPFNENPTNHTPLTTNHERGEVVSARATGPELVRMLKVAAGWEREPAPKLEITGPIEALMDAGCDLHTDVLPTIKAIAPEADSRTSWNFFLKAIARARDQRLTAGSLKPKPYGKSNGSHQQKSTRSDTFAKIHARIAAAELASGEGGGEDDGNTVEGEARD